MKSNIIDKEEKETLKWDLEPIYKSDDNVLFFSVDDIINAYLAGKADTLKNFTDVALGEAFAKNLELAKSSSVKFYQDLIDAGIRTDKVYLKIKNKERFNAIFSIDENQWCQDDFNKFYIKAMDIQESVNSDSFDYAIILMPKSDSFNKEALVSDGYLLSYGI